MSDLYGRRRFFCIGLVLFALASLTGGLAPNEIVLIAARAIQGVGAAVASATSLSLLIVSFAEGKERNRALSVFSAVSSAGFAAGVVLGGVLTASLGWRSIFFINVPIGIVAALLTLRYVSESSSQTAAEHLDLPGAITVTLGLSLLVYALTEAANTSLFSVGTLSLLGVSAAVLISFFAIEHRSKNPLMPLSFLRRRTPFAANAIAILIVSTVSSLIFLITIFLQQIQGFSALSAGLAFLPTGLVFLVGSGFLSARFVTRFGMRGVLVWSMVVLGAGFFLLSFITPTTPFFSYLLPSMLVVSAGAASAWTAFYIAALSGARQGEEGLASGVINTSTQVGGPIGLAIAVTIASVVASQLAGKIGVPAATVAGFGYSFLADVLLAITGVALAAVLLPPQVVGIKAQKIATGEAVQPPLTVSPQTGIAPPNASKGASMKINIILVAVDGSENAQRAADTAIKLARDYQAEIIFLRVVTVPNTLTPGAIRAGGATILQQFYDYSLRDAEDYVSLLVSEANKAGVSSARGEVLRATSSPASVIVDKAKTEQADLIVIGTRGLDRPQRLLQGSVSSEVVAGADTQVLVVR